MELVAWLKAEHGLGRNARAVGADGRRRVDGGLERKMRASGCTPRAADGPLKGFLRSSDAPIVSRAIVRPGAPLSTDLVKIFGWCDNDWGLHPRAAGLHRVALVSRAGDEEALPVVFGAGAAIGVLGGMIGLGGAEFRLPLLISLFGFAALSAVILNKAMSLIVVLVKFARDLGHSMVMPRGCADAAAWSRLE
ncbi:MULTISPECIES: hypothetical protein [unclassified Streptomyces]|uniref:hypothetical protein n=1 Tax=unclassified Streptomyces TaxID=2593676 RepID=UPI0036E97AE1